ncbi:MAG: FAD-dependent oxidoreductase [Hyphomicrobiales bacterium]|nr:FAD-dependent oxidoreductase [Hyphomicrobiales bacterium]
MHESRSIEAQCCIVGGGPAGMMAGYLLARAGVDVVVLEKHGDFLRDFRGDTIHPSTLELIDELGLLDEFLRLPHAEMTHIDGLVGRDSIRLADFSHLPTRCKFIALMPQWNFLDFFARHARRLPNFRLLMKAQATDLLKADNRVNGVAGVGDDGAFAVRAGLTIAADGRHSLLRERSGLAVRDLGAPMDVLWLRLSKQPDDEAATFGRISAGAMFIVIDRDDYWQCALVIRKGSGAALKAQGLAAFRDLLARASGLPRERFEEIDDLDKAKLLTVTVDRLERWAVPGLLFIGDSAHAMSPVGGVGINLAIQDAVATANILGPTLQAGRAALADLNRVQARRAFAVRATQTLQVFIQNRVVGPSLASAAEPHLPAPMKLFNALPFLQRIPARLIGLGVRPEHIDPRILIEG